MSIEDAVWFARPVVASSLGELHLDDGVPTVEAAALVHDHLLHLRAVDVFLSTYRAVSVDAIHRAFLDAGIADGDVLLFSGLMDSRSLFLTANCDTVYFWTFLDMTGDPVVLEVPSGVVGVIDDLRFDWVGDFGGAGPDRGAGGRYLLVPDRYDGPLPEGGYFTYRTSTTHVVVLGRAFLIDGQPDKAVANIKELFKISPYTPGGYGSSLSGFLTGTGPLAAPVAASTPRFVEGTGMVIDTIPPNDFSYFERVSEVVQTQPVGVFSPEVAGQLAAIGIVKGRDFAPTDHDRAVLTAAIAVANVAARAISFRERPDAGFAYYDNSPTWFNPLFVSGYDFLNPPPYVTPTGLEPLPATGALSLDGRAAMFYMATFVTPAMATRVPGLGSQYLVAATDADGGAFDGGVAYSITLPKDPPGAALWSLTLYDNQSRSMLQTGQRYPRAGSQAYPTPAAEVDDDGTTTVWCAPRQPDGVALGNWIQTVPGRGWFAMFRLYSPTQAFFDKTWQLGEFVPA
jgi:hypothetical protein